MDAETYIRVLVAEGEYLLRAGLARLLAPFRDIRATAEAGTTTDVLTRLRTPGADVIIMGGRLEDQRASAAVTSIRTEGWRTPILVLGASYHGPHLASDAVRAGATAFMPTNVEPEQLARAIRRLHAGQPLFEAQPRWGMRMNGQTGGRLITPREQEVLAHLERGLSNRQIGNELGIAMRTVDKHVENLMRKFEVRDRRDLAAHYRLAAS